MNRADFQKAIATLKQEYRDSLVEDYIIWQDRVTSTNEIIKTLENEGVEPESYNYDEYGQLCVDVFEEHIDELLWFDKEVDAHEAHVLLYQDMFKEAQKRAQEEAFVQSLKRKLSYEVKKSDDMFFRALWRSSAAEVDERLKNEEDQDQ